MAVLTIKQEDVLKELSKLPDDSVAEVLDFIKFLRIRDGDAVDFCFDDDFSSSKEEGRLEREKEKA